MPVPARRSHSPPVNYKPKYLTSDQSSKERWLISYTDFVTILMILFVAIAAQGMHSPAQPSSAQQPKPKATNPEAKINDAHQALAGANRKLRLEGLDSHLEKRGLVISLPQAILFPSGEDHVVPTALPIVAQIAEVLNSVPNKVALVGHADSIPIHNKRFQSNWELSAARSLNLLGILSSRYGVAESRLSVQSFGSNEPKDSNDTEAGRAENRRVEILLLDESAQ
jgi:chemotaxis protein MotB